MSETPAASAEPPEERLAERLAASPKPGRSTIAAALHELANVDRAVYGAIASTPDDDARRAAASPVRARQQLGALARDRGGIFAVGGKRGTPRGPHRRRRDRPQLRRREPAHEDRQQASPPGPGDRRRPGGALGDDADQHVVPIGPLGLGVRVRGRGRGGAARPGGAVASARRRRRLLARPHRRALPRRCDRGSSSGRRSGRPRHSPREPCTGAVTARRTG